eukprot:12630277-Alexandrium_andersonii.AAC.1
MLADRLAVHGLGKHIGGVIDARPLDEFRVPRPDFLLNPQLAHSQVAHPPNASAAANADRRTTVG